MVKKSEVRRGAASASVDHAVKALAGRLTRGMLASERKSLVLVVLRMEDFTVL